jgi:hypothetical protein
MLGKHAWAPDNIVLIPFPLCVPVTPFTKPSATAAATIPSARVQYIRVRVSSACVAAERLECATALKYEWASCVYTRLEAALSRIVKILESPSGIKPQVGDRQAKNI